MKHLILKDINLLTIANGLLPLIWLLLSYNVKSKGDTLYAKALFHTCLFIMVFAISLLLTKHDDNSNVDIILNSLPIDRKTIVKSRYITIAMYIIFISVGFFTAFHLVNPMLSRFFGSITINLYDILFIIGLILMFFSLYLPLHFLSLGRTSAFNEGFIMVLILIPALVVKFSEKFLDEKIINALLNKGFNNFAFILLGFGIVLYMLSLQVSKGIYKRKEF